MRGVVGAAEAQYNVRGWEERRAAVSQTQKREERIAEVHVYCANSNKPTNSKTSTQLTRIKRTGAQNCTAEAHS